MAEYFNQLSPQEAEALAILGEECAEVGQVIGKIQRHGLFSRNPFDPQSLSNLDELKVELGDILAAIRVLQKVGLLNESELPPLRDAKLKKLPRFLHHIQLD